MDAPGVAVVVRNICSVREYNWQLLSNLRGEAVKLMSDRNEKIFHAKKQGGMLF